MYAEFYALTTMPFQLTPDSRFFFGSSEHKKAMAFLDYGLSQGEGFVVVTGDVGVGKTILVDHHLSTLDSRRYVAGRVVTTQLDAADMLRMVGASFDLFRDGMDKATVLDRLRQFIASTGKRPILIIDEAQSLNTEALEELRMLSNIVVPGAAPLQTILLGQPEFRDTLARDDVKQVRQRVIASCHMGPLETTDTRHYIEHRLRRAGWKDDPSFSDQAFDAIHRLTGGIPRRINTLCSRLLLLGFIEEMHHVDAAMVEAVGNELAAELGPLPRSAGALASIEQAETASAGQIRALREDMMARLAKLEQRLDRHESALRGVQAFAQPIYKS